jgi:hypothetical protein
LSDGRYFMMLYRLRDGCYAHRPTPGSGLFSPAESTHSPPEPLMKSFLRILVRDFAFLAILLCSVVASGRQNDEFAKLQSQFESSNTQC